MTGTVIWRETARCGLANAMREHCSATDIALRYDGDEIALIPIDAVLLEAADQRLYQKKKRFAEDGLETKSARTF